MLEKLSLKGRVALVTGGTGGLGGAIVLAYAEAGADVIVSGRRREAGEKTAAQIRDMGGKAVFIQADVIQSESVNALMAEGIAQWGRIDILVNGAGIVKTDSGESASISKKPLWEISDREWREGIDTNLSGAFYCTRAVAKHMADRGYGRVINISSGFGFRGLKNAYMYTAAKAGLVTLTMTLALSLSEYGIRVNAIAPGLFRTHGSKERYDAAERFIPVGYTAEPSEISGLAVLLGSEASDYINGETYIIDGGALANGAAPINYSLS